MPPEQLRPRTPELSFRRGFRAGALAVMRAIAGGVSLDELDAWLEDAVGPWVERGKTWKRGDALDVCPAPTPDWKRQEAG